LVATTESGQLELAHLRNRGAHRGLQPRPRREAEGKTGTIARQETAATEGTPTSVVISSNQCPAPRRCGVPELPQQIFSCDAGFMPAAESIVRTDRPPPQRGRIALDQFQETVQGCGLPRRTSGRSDTQRKRRREFALCRRAAQADVGRQQHLDPSVDLVARNHESALSGCVRRSDRTATSSSAIGPSLPAPSSMRGLSSKSLSVCN
jgi:hypothetical protein